MRPSGGKRLDSVPTRIRLFVCCDGCYNPPSTHTSLCKLYYQWSQERMLPIKYANLCEWKFIDAHSKHEHCIGGGVCPYNPDTEAQSPREKFLFPVAMLYMQVLASASSHVLESSCCLFYRHIEPREGYARSCRLLTRWCWKHKSA